MDNLPPHLSDHQPLPTPRALLTSLLTTLFTASPIPASSLQQAWSESHGSDAPFIPPYTTSTSAIYASRTAIKPETKEDRSSNPLETLPAGKKALLSTLHVLFPPPTLLQALDLLDRGLVRRVVWEEEDGDSEGVAGGIPVKVSGGRRESQGDGGGGGYEIRGVEGRGVMPPQASIQLPTPSHPRPSQQTQPKPSKPPRHIYQVLSSTLPSAHPTRGRPRDHSTHTNTGKIYTVHLEAWNCNCAAFAFAAFPYVSPGSLGEIAAWRAIFGDEEKDEDEGEDRFLDRHTDSARGRERYILQKRGLKEEGEAKYGAEDETWEFGGLSLEGKGAGRESEGVPVCKHLLAVLLVAKWDLLKGFVEERRLGWERGREEAAGLAAAS